MTVNRPAKQKPEMKRIAVHAKGSIASAITNQVINDALETQPYSFVDDVTFIIRQQGPTEIY
jgi:hypothetical protein